MNSEVKAKADLGAKFRRLTSFQQQILLAIADIRDEPYGLEIKKQLQIAREEEINHGRLYPNLNKLKDDGWIQKSKIDDRTNKYELTDKSREALHQYYEWVGESIGEDRDA